MERGVETPQVMAHCVGVLGDPCRLLTSSERVQWLGWPGQVKWKGDHAGVEFLATAGSTACHQCVPGFLEPGHRLAELCSLPPSRPTGPMQWGPLSGAPLEQDAHESLRPRPGPISRFQSGGCWANPPLSLRPAPASPHAGRWPLRAGAWVFRGHLLPLKGPCLSESF